MNRLPYLLCVLLAACATPPAEPPAPAPQPVVTAPVPSVPVVQPPAPVIPPDTPPVQREIDGLLSYHRALRQLSHTDLLLEMDSLNLQPSSPRVTLQKAMTLSLIRGNGDFAKAQLYAESVANSVEASAQPLKPLAKLLAANYAELRRMAEQSDKLSLQVRENQRRIEQLNDMLEGLKAIERTLPARPSGAVPARPQSFIR